MCQNLIIQDVTIATKGGHSVSISGALTGCEMRNITLHQQPGGPVPNIGLYPVRIGGNMADDGVIYVFDFAKGSGHEYGKVLSSNNKVYKTGQSQAETIQPVDHRAELPENYLKMAFGIRNFNYTQYI